MTANDFCNEYLNAFKTKKNIKGKYIWGDSGIGKTHLVKLLLKEIDNYNLQLKEKRKAINLKIDELEKIRNSIWKEADKMAIEQLEFKIKSSTYNLDSIFQKIKFKTEYCSKNSKYVETDNEIKKLNDKLNDLGKELTYEFLEISNFIKNEKDKFGTSTKLTNLQKYLTADVLVLDDIGKQQFCFWGIINIIFPIIQIRYDSKQTTFFTSNHSIDELHKKMCLAKESNVKDIEAVISRIKGLTVEKNMYGKDRRMDDW